MTINIALAQLQLKFGDLNANLAKLQETATGLPAGTLLLLPELWSSSYDLRNTAVITRENRRIFEETRKIAQESRIYIGGSLLEEIEGRVFNSFSLIQPDGDTAASYQKIHLFRLMEEEKWMSPGNRTATVDLEEGRAGLAVCYDLRFPELFRKYALLGCKLILLVAEWPAIRISHWKTLLRARAIENQMFIAAVNNVGTTGETDFGGSSVILDPWGQTIAEGSATQPQLVTGQVDLTLVDEIRRKIPVFEDRRPDLY